MKPVDFLEIMWTRDIVDLQWEIIRYRRIKADAITYYHEGRCLERSAQAEISEREFRAKATKKEIAAYEARRLERSAQIGEETRAKLLKNDIAAVVAFRIDALERIDRMVMNMEARRNAAYREAERHRIGLGDRLRHATEQVEDAEFREVDEATTGEQKRVA